MLKLSQNILLSFGFQVVKAGKWIGSLLRWARGTRIVGQKIEA